MLRTHVVETDLDSPAGEKLEEAARAIAEGKVVALPSDTLYVLAADPFNLNAVREVFQAKGRDSGRSLPLLVDSVTMVEEYAVEVTPRFSLLSRRFWPGPLTIILEAASTLPLRVTGNSGRMAVRHSNSPVIEGVIERLGRPIIGTSANCSGQPTCRSGFEVLGTMDGRVDLIVDGGTVAGLGATTIDITEPDWQIIREGAIPESVIAEYLDV